MIRLFFSFFRGMRKGVANRQVQVLLLFVSLFLYSATGFMYFEQPANPDLSWLDSFWWALVTMTTVGYGDYFPVSNMGRIVVAFPAMLLGIGILGYVLSLLATAMIESKLRETKGMKQITLNEHVLICNYVNIENTCKLIHEIRKDSCTEDCPIVLVNDELEELPAELADLKVHFVKGDPAREGILAKAGLQTARAIIIQADPRTPADSDNKNLKTILTVQSICPSVLCVAECVNPENEIYFKRANCDSVVCIAALTEQMLIQELQDPGVSQIISELTSNARGRQFYITDLPADIKTYLDLEGFYASENMALLGIRRNEENYLLPEKDLSLQADDRAILIAAQRPCSTHN